MKTKSLLNTSFLIVLMGINGIMNAQVIFTVGNLEYYENEPGGVSVTLVGHVDGWEATGELVIPESITYMGMNLAVTAIADYAFNGCSGLTGSLNIPNSIISLGYAAFHGCWGFTGSLAIPNSISSISSGAFYDCAGFSNIIIPNSVTNIEIEAFAYCTGLTGTLNIPNSVTNISARAFEGCSGLSSLYIPSSVTELSFNPFPGCTGLEEIIVDAENPVYDSRNNCNAIMHTLSSELVAGCRNTIIPNSTVSIGVNAFSDCITLTDVTIPNSVSEIQSGAFYGCVGLMSIDLPNSVTFIDDMAFSNCGISTIYIPSSVTHIGENPFFYCLSLEEITVDPFNTVYDSRNNCNAIINTTTLELVSGCKNTVMPDNITAIGRWAFAYCLTGTLTIPQSVVSIGAYAFLGCNGLTGLLNIPNSVTAIGTQAFSYCTGFTGSLIIPNHVTTIGNYAFEDCSGFDGTLVIGSSVSKIGDRAFNNCTGFTEAVSLAVEPPTIGDYIIDHLFYNFGCSTLTVPCGCVSAYQGTNWYDPYWGQGFSTILEDCSSVPEFDENSVSLYPNPTSGSINIEAENIQSVSIYNMLGKKVFESAVHGDSFNYDFSSNESGVYIIRIETPQGVATNKVTVK